MIPNHVWEMNKPVKSVRIMDVKEGDKNHSIKIVMWYRDGLIHAIPHEFINGQWVANTERTWRPKKT